MNEVLICGSSYTSGDGLLDRNDAWPNLFQQLSGMKSINTAVDGGSVDYVCYSVVKEVSVHNYKNVIITWPPLGRKLLVRRENNFLINGNPTFTNKLYGNSPEFKNFLNLFYKYWSNELYDLKFTLQKILLMQHFLESKNCKYMFINTNPYNLKYWTSLSTLPAIAKSRMLSTFELTNDEQILNDENEIKSYVDQLNLDRYYDPINYNLTSDCFSKNLIDPKTNHPSVEGHKYMTELIWGLWTKNYR